MLRSMTIALTLWVVDPGHAGKESSEPEKANTHPQRSSVKEVKKQLLERMTQKWKESWDIKDETQGTVIPVKGQTNTQVNCYYNCLVRNERTARTFERLHRLAKVQGLTTLYANNVVGEHRNFIIRLIIKNRETLEHINLRSPSWNRVDFGESLRLCPRLKTVRYNHEDWLASTRSSTSLYLWRSSFGQSSAPIPLMRELIQKWPQTVPLTSLSVEFCAPHDIATLIEKSSQLASLHLDFSDWECSIEDTSQIFDAMRGHPHLETLSVSNNENTKATPSQVLRKLVRAITGHTTLRALDIRSLTFPLEETPILGEALLTLPHFSTFNVHRNRNFGPRGFEILSPYLARCTQLVDLDVGSILTQSSLPHLLVAISGSHATLQRIDCFACDDYTDDPSVLTALFPLAQALEKCTQFNHLHAGYVDWKTIHALTFLRQRSTRTDPNATPSLNLMCSGYNWGSIRYNVTERLESYLNLTVPENLTDRERWQKERENRAAVSQFLTKCREEKFFVLSDPKFEALLEKG